MGCRVVLGAMILFVVGCGSTSENRGDRVVECELSKSESVSQITDLFDSAEIISLDSSVVSSDSEIIEHKGDYIVFSKIHKNCFRFDPEGRFLNKIGGAGNARDEYLSISNIQMDGDCVLIYSNAKSSIYRYTLDGEFISVEDVGIRAQQLLKVGSRYYGYFGYGNGQQSERLLVYDEDFEVVGRHLSSEAQVISFSDMVDPLTICGRGVSIRETYGRSLFTLSADGELSEPLGFDFGRYNIPSECFTQSDAMRAAEMMLSRSFATIYRSGRGGEFVQVNFQMTDGDEPIYSMVGVERDGHYKWITSTPSGECALLFSTLRYVSDDGSIVALVDREVLENFHSKSSEFIENIDQLDSNSVVVKFKFGV